MTQAIPSAHPFDEAALEQLALDHATEANEWQSHLRKHHLDAAKLIRSAIKVHAEVCQRVVDLTTEFHLSEYERAALLKEVLRLREALQQARDTRPNENYKVVTIDLEIVDVLLGKTFPLNPARDSSKL